MRAPRPSLMRPSNNQTASAICHTPNPPRLINCNIPLSRRPIYRRCTPQIPINPKPHNITINHPLLADADLPCKV